jgi:coenzyme F420-dependent glucose-6-phosphate dehydrogenase
MKAARVAYHASHEQFPPSRLLQLAGLAEKAGFTGISSSDHLQPWTPAQGHSGFAWSWLGAAMATTRLPYSVVTAPGQRYHPAVIAQAAATLEEMFPGRLTVAFGSGENLNEHVTGERWPTKAERNARLKECVEVIEALWAGKTVQHRGLVTVEQTRLYSLPPRPPRWVGAAVSNETARWLGGWADGLVTVSRDLEGLRQVADAFREGGGDGKPMLLKVQVSFARNLEEARRGAHEQWAANTLPSSLLGDLRYPSQFEAAGKAVKPGDLEPMVLLADDAEALAEQVSKFLALGFTEITLHNVNLEQEAFIEACSAVVLPRLQGA